MANIDIEIAGRRYNVACRDGEEEQLRAVAAQVDRRARDAESAVGSLTETRQLLFAALLLADDLRESAAGNPPPPAPADDPALAEALERLAGRVENLADRLESEASTH